MKYLLLSLLLLSLPVAAAPPPVKTDKPVPLTIEADHLELDQKHGTSHYQGRVILMQGTLQIKADNVTLYSVEKKLRRVVAEGSPTTLLQQGDGETSPLRAEAARMEYMLQSREIQLSGKARLWRDGNEFSGEQISYNLQQQLVKASGDTQGDGRVRVLLQPENTNQQQETPP
jgi:lipopolysaccharide export system protein LptA